MCRPPSDSELLRDYACSRSEPAFAELVRRHLNLVYGAACRRLGANALAADVAQSVFLDLARSAASLRVDQTLAAWLYTVTQRTAADVLRRESRRLARERTATELHAMATPSWVNVVPLLDDALARLSTAERTAILLRYFENRSLRDVGTALAVSDDAAQKRLSRALDRLRTFFHRRGITITAAALATSITTQLAALPALSLSQTATTLLMTTTQKVLVATTVLTLLGGGLYEARVIARQAAELRDLRQQATQLETDLTGLRRERAAQATALADERAKSAKYTAVDPEIEAALDDWLQNVVRLKAQLAKYPRSQIPELKYLTAKDWLDATKETKLDTELDIRRALHSLRMAAKQHFLSKLHKATQLYLAAHQDQPPTDSKEIASYFEAAIDPAILPRYQVRSPNELPPSFPQIVNHDGQLASWVICEREDCDDYYDSQIFVTASASGVYGVSKFEREVSDAIKAYRAANANTAPTTAAQLAPYLHSVIDPTYVQDQLKPRP